MRAEKRMSHLVTKKQVLSWLGWNQRVEATEEMEEKRERDSHAENLVAKATRKVK